MNTGIYFPRSGKKRSDRRFKLIACHALNGTVEMISLCITGAVIGRAKPRRPRLITSEDGRDAGLRLAISALERLDPGARHLTQLVMCIYRLNETPSPPMLRRGTFHSGTDFLFYLDKQIIFDGTHFFAAKK